ncbi:grasp-with-spasm system SPASM domain peptide maturase [Chryseobacterium gotjawalense]|uniref:Grasp-with-spasm system SPASM domain peptide maturase n=1 Tax=Chryseobacterium gotjawalense TaxID=3042315 RepID=A0ABY8RD65_9FLAO|nr:grasp-with-spasm system SPASM domain peptide maturase [Chryseobacterium sp. wdc7]WHF51913.1 grasp-with-spasm system SPASM domain peptide maturase [Chryseobacterium sp. wdc7]
MRINNFLYLYSCCIPIKGVKQSIICDIQRRNWEPIPNSLFDILINLDKERNLTKLKGNYTDESEIEIFNSYIDFLVEHEFIFMDDSLHKRFPLLDISFDTPSVITNSVIEVNNVTVIRHLIEKIDELDNLRCESVELRFHNDSFEKRFDDILSLFNNTGIRSLRLILNNFNFSDDFFSILAVKYKRIRDVYICGLDDLNNINCQSFPVISLSSNYLSKENCGHISEFNFSTDIRCFTESNFHNSCLHKKIAIDIDGNIKNCPSMSQSFGNIKNTTLKEALNQKDFKKYWNVTKDEIEVCKDCEFRYICTDCRAYTERTHTNEEGLDVSKPLKCGYDPYTGKWEEWSKNPLKEKAINFYEMEDLVKNK